MSGHVVTYFKYSIRSLDCSNSCSVGIFVDIGSVNAFCLFVLFLSTKGSENTYSFAIRERTFWMMIWLNLTWDYWEDSYSSRSSSLDWVNLKIVKKSERKDEFSWFFFLISFSFRFMSFKSFSFVNDKQNNPTHENKQISNRKWWNDLKSITIHNSI